jgi:hypothetical protein
VQEGRGDEALLLVRSENSEAARRRLATAGKAVVGVEQSSEEAAVKRWVGEAKWAVASSGEVRAQG